MATTQLSWDWDLTTSILPNLPHPNFRMARTKLTLQKGKRSGERKVLRSRTIRMILAEKGRRLLSPVHHPSPAKEASSRREEMEKQVEAAEQLEGWGGHCCCCPPDSWSKWLQKPDHLSQAGRNLCTRSSDQPWEAKPPRRNSCRQAK